MTEDKDDDWIGYCPDCGAEPGQYHLHGCDVERCPRCGFQLISCNCIYEVCGMDPETLETEHPEIYMHGAADEMWTKWDAEWGSRRQRWTGKWPGRVEAREFGWFCKCAEGSGWVRCPADDPEAKPDLNRLNTSAVWDAERGRFVLRGDA